MCGGTRQESRRCAGVRSWPAGDVLAGNTTLEQRFLQKAASNLQNTNTHLQRHGLPLPARWVHHLHVDVQPQRLDLKHAWRHAAGQARCCGGALGVDVDVLYGLAHSDLLHAGEGQPLVGRRQDLVCVFGGKGTGSASRGGKRQYKGEEEWMNKSHARMQRVLTVKL